MEKENTTQFLMRPKNDFCFKQLMADAQIRQAFLSAVTGIPYEEIEETTLLPTSLEKRYKEDKLGILDVRIQLKNSGQVDVEMQVAAYEYWAERTLFYLSKMFTEQIHEGEGYDVLEKCIHIGILDFEIFEDTDAFYSRFHLWEDSRHIKYSDKLELHVLELPKLAKHQYPETELLSWMQFINAETEEEFKMAAEKDPYIEKAYESLVHLSADERARLEYEAREKQIRDHQFFSRIYKDPGYRQGVKEGEEKGREKGRIQECIEILQEMGETKEHVLLRLKEKFKLSDTDANQYLEKYWKE